MNKYILIPLVLLILISCEKVIDIDLNQSNPRFVIEGNLSNVAGASKVRISKTLNFDETTAYPAISGTLVTITDNKLNQTDTLTETSAGIYFKSGLAGIEGHPYTMMVKIGNEIFTAVSTMPNSVNLDSLVQENLAGSGTGGGPGGSGGPGNPGGDHDYETIIQITPHYTDPVNSENYYQFEVTRNDTLVNDVFIRNDVGFNGSSSHLPLRVKTDKGDVVTIDLQCIDKTVYNYFFGLNENINQSSATPANPASNINNGALGYFKAHTSKKKTIRIE
ncbi:MAG TPA: hypothetical protein DCR40_01555 [Prolixibacteraceae bacterium]|nr:hypothetical protein [Prolixibacteraceae bacterium]